MPLLLVSFHDQGTCSFRADAATCGDVGCRHQDLAWQAVVYKHPGYPANKEAAAPGVYVPHHAAVAAAEAQIRDYLTAVAHSRICLFDSSVVRKGLAKFFEALMGGCVPASDLPLEMEDVLQDAMIVLDPTDSEQQIAAQARRARNFVFQCAAAHRRAGNASAQSSAQILCICPVAG